MRIDKSPRYPQCAVVLLDRLRVVGRTTLAFKYGFINVLGDCVLGQPSYYSFNFCRKRREKLPFTLTVVRHIAHTALLVYYTAKPEKTKRIWALIMVSATLAP